MKINKKVIIFSFLLSFFPIKVFAHCPLCTIGTGWLILVARWLGVSSIVIGLFVGSFTVALGLFSAKILKKKFKKRGFFFDHSIVAFSFLSIVLPIILTGNSDYIILNLSIFGKPGTFLNRIYLLNSFLVGSIIGVGIFYFGSYFNKKIAKLRKGKHLPFGGIIIPILLLIIFAILIELVKNNL